MRRDELGPEFDAEFEALDNQIDDVHQLLVEQTARFAELYAQIAEAKAEAGIDDDGALEEGIMRYRTRVDALIARRRARKAHEARKHRPCQVRARPRISRPRERRERRHVARSTSSADSPAGDSDPPCRSAATRAVVA
jgi:hypothetical protein